MEEKTFLRLITELRIHASKEAISRALEIIRHEPDVFLKEFWVGARCPYCDDDVWYWYLVPREYPHWDDEIVAYSWALELGPGPCLCEPDE